VQFEITAATRDAVQAWIKHARLKPEDLLLPSRLHNSPHLGTREYARILGGWVEYLGLDQADYGTHSMQTQAIIRPAKETGDRLAGSRPPSGDIVRGALGQSLPAIRPTACLKVIIRIDDAETRQSTTLSARSGHCRCDSKAVIRPRLEPKLRDSRQ